MNWVFSFPFLLLVVFLTFVPLVQGFFLFPVSLSIQELGRWFQDGSTQVATTVSFLFACVATILSIGLGTVVAFTLHEMKRFSRVSFFFILLLWSVPLYVSLPTLRIGFAYASFNPIASPLSSWITITLTRIWADLPLCVLVGLACYQKVPPSIRDSLRIDGASATARMQAVYRHAISPNFQALSILLLLNNLRDLTLPLMLTEGRPMMAQGFTALGSAGATTTYGILLRNTMKSHSPDLWLNASAIGVSLILLAVFWVYWLNKKSFSAAMISMVAIEWLWRVVRGGDTILLLLLLIASVVSLRVCKRTMNLWVYSMLGMILGFLSIQSASPIVYLLFFILAMRVLFSSWGFRGIIPVGRIGLVSLIASAAGILILLVATGFTNALYLPEWEDLSHFSLNHLQNLFHRGFDTNLLNSLWIALGAGVLSIGIVPIAAAACVQSKKITLVSFFLVSATLVLTGMNTLSPLYVLFRNMGLLNSHFPLILTAVQKTLPLGFFILYEELKALPPELREAAIIDGAGSFTVFRKILFPLLLPSALVVFIHGFINGWTTFVAPLVFLTDPRLFPTSLRLYDFAGNLSLSYSQWGLFSVGALLSAGVSMALLISLRSRMVKGYLSEYH